MQIIEILDENIKSEITEEVLKKLPDWFSLESAILEYMKGVYQTMFYTCRIESKDIGFISIKKHFDNSYEIYVMGVNEKFHNSGIGTELLNTALREIKNVNAKLLQVKTLSFSRPDKFYDQTRNFYLKNGFIPVEEFKNLWDEANPCLQLIKFIT